MPAETYDSLSYSGDIIGGNDTLDGGAGADTLIGDHIAAHTETRSSGIFKDAVAISGDIIGGDDILSGGAGNDTLIGDSGSASSHASAIASYGYYYQTAEAGQIIGGADTLEGGAGDDQIWGDNRDGSGVGGDDTFVFVNGEGGTDIIWDFEGAGTAGGDVIEAHGFTGGTITTFTGLSTINGVSYDAPLSGALITAEGQQIYVVGATELGAGDIILV